MKLPCPLGPNCCVLQEKFLRKPYSKSFTDQACSVKMAGYWPRSFFFANLRLCSDLVPEHSARERFLMGTNVNTPKLQVPTPEFGHLYSGTTLVFFSVLRHQCSGTKCKHSRRISTPSRSINTHTKKRNWPVSSKPS